MKSKILAFLLFITPGFICAQNIGDFFKMIPAEDCFNLSIEERQQMIDNYNAENEERISSNMLALNNYDLSNGYISMNGIFEGHWEMCYWNISTGEKLVGVTESGCGPACMTIFFNFYLYSDKELKPVKTEDIIPEITVKHFLKEGESLEIESLELTYYLPQKGKNITVAENWDLREYDYDLSVLKGQYIELKWNDGKMFIIGEAHD